MSYFRLVVATLATFVSAVQAQIPTARPPVPGAPTGSIALVDVTVIPMDTERVLRHQTVVVEQGWITALGPSQHTPVPANAVRIDGRSKYLMPGLTDMHAHLHIYIPLGGRTADSDEVLRRKVFSYLAHGVTGVRHLGSDGKPYMRLRSSEMLAPRFYFAPSLHGIDRPTSLNSVAPHIASYKAAGYDFIEVPADYVHRPSEQRAVYDSLMTAAHRLGLAVSSHTNDESFEDMLAFGTYGGSVEHLYGFWDGVRRLETGGSGSEKMRSLAEAARRAGVWITVTLLCQDHRSPGVEIGRQLVKALQDAGVKLLLGADTPGGNERWLTNEQPPSVIHEELAELVRAGLTPYQALVTGTRNPAQYFGILDSSGTVTAGKRADLVLLSGNPLADIRYTREPAGVMIAGRWLSREELSHRLAFRTLKEQQGSSLDYVSAVYNPLLFAAITTRPGHPAMSAAEQAGVSHLGTAHQAQWTALADSLIAPDSLGADSQSVAARQQRLLNLVARQFGEIRAILTSEQQVVFDMKAREWLREQARHGRSVRISGVTP